MSRFQGNALINRPLNEVWGFISDPANAHIWGRGVSEVVVTSSGPVAVGTTLRLRMAGSKMEARITEFTEMQRFAVKFTAGPVAGSKMTYSMEDVNGSTSLTRDLELRLSGLWRLMRPVLTRREIRDRDAGVANVKLMMESRGSQQVT